MFLDLDCLEAFFGGAAAGGKSDALLMAALKYVHVPGYAALILRRDFARLNLAGAIMDRSKMWLLNTDAVWNEMGKRWTFPSGATIEFGYIDSPDDAYRYASSEYQCVAKGTMIKIPGGTKEVENIRVGDVVLTLSGPRRVSKTFKPRITDCVRITSKDGWQECPVTHRVLTAFGWRSYTALASSLCRSDLSFSMLRRSVRKPSGQLQPRCQYAQQTHESILCQLPPNRAQAELLPRQPDSGDYVALSEGAENASEAYCDCIQELQQPGELSCLGVLHAQNPPLKGIGREDRLRDSAGPCGQISTAVVEDCRGGCFGDSCLGGEQLLRDSAGGLLHLPSQVDAVRHSLPCLPLDAMECTPLRNHEAIWYDHPYGKGFRCLSVGVRFSPLHFLPIGKRLVYDFTVEDCNNYISSSNVVNVNCICFDELTEFRLPAGDANPYQFLFSRLRRTRDIPVPLRMRAASNPGKAGHKWVKTRFITDAAVAAILNGFNGVLDAPDGRKFVPSKVRDNPAIDPEEYEVSLSHLSAVTKAQLMSGDWTVSEGTQIDPSWLHYYDLNGQILRFGSNGSTVAVDERVCRRFAVIDTAGTSKEKAAEDRGRPPSWSVCGTFDHSTVNKMLYVRDVSRWRVAYPELKARVKATLLRWRTVKVYVENAHFGPALVADLQLDPELRHVKFEMLPTKLPGMNADGEGAKLERATAAGLFDELEHGRFRLPSGPETPAWLSDYEGELSSWTGRSEETADQIDVSSYACYIARKQSKTWGGKGIVTGGGFR